MNQIGRTVITESLCRCWRELGKAGLFQADNDSKSMKVHRLNFLVKVPVRVSNWRCYWQLSIAWALNGLRSCVPNATSVSTNQKQWPTLKHIVGRSWEITVLAWKHPSKWWKPFDMLPSVKEKLKRRSDMDVTGKLIHPGRQHPASQRMNQVGK